MRQTIDETERRRKKQIRYNEENGITPMPIVKKSTARDLIDLYSGETNESGQKGREKERKSGKKSVAPKSGEMSGKGSGAKAPRPYIEEEHQQGAAADPIIEYMNIPELELRIEKVNSEMVGAARRMEFIEAARLRDELLSLKELLEGKKAEEFDEASNSHDE